MEVYLDWDPIFCLRSFQIRPIFIINELSQGNSDGNQFINSDQHDYCTIAINPIINEGIVKIEIIYENTGICDKIVGIADSSCSFATGKGPSANRNDNKTIRYWNDGCLNHITYGTKRNQSYVDGERIGIEVDMTKVPRRVTFFINDVEQPNYVVGIPSEIRFWAYTNKRSSSFIINKFQRLIQSTAKGVAGSKALQWGKEWWY
ncbi:MAG: hypothetical protein EZS28_026224 [Streblomastix strix]|uniref:B30.2/SPRY domain-containing protein n=1 Tax=Streblomastix strix TaxID=222440 RepID=A0A5J4V697_9EUKA|nr:MAG: hypothetical protein EZS28_026224 [Streblomastix strix]